MHGLWLVEDFVISHDTRLMWSEFSRGSKFPKGCFVFCQWYAGHNKHDISTKDATKFGVTLFKRKIWCFFLLNEINLFNSCGNWLLILLWVIKAIVFNGSNIKPNSQHNSNASEQLYQNNYCHSLSENWWIIPSTSSQGLFNNFYSARGK